MKDQVRAQIVHRDGTLEPLCLRNVYAEAISGKPVTYRYVVEVEDPRPVWQPIETAPKDGTAVLVWLAGNRSDQFNDRPMVVKHDGYSGWGFPGVGGLNASHWQPLPGSPK